MGSAVTVTVVVADAQPPLPRPPLSWATGQYRSFHAPCGVVPGGLDVLERDGAVSPELSPPAAAMQRYVLGASLGSGAFGTVRTAHLASDGRKFALKTLKKQAASIECALELREVRALKVLRHPHVIALHEIIFANGRLHFVLQHMEMSLLGLVDKRGAERRGSALPPLSEGNISTIFRQVFQALAFIHESGWVHRDVKPENILLRQDHVVVAEDGVRNLDKAYYCALGDFGMARRLPDSTENPPIRKRARVADSTGPSSDSKRPLTDYVATRWYRAPELLLHSQDYGPAADVWAAGAVMAEAFRREALFQGENEDETMRQIFEVRGSPSSTRWPEGVRLAERAGTGDLPRFTTTHISVFVPTAGAEAQQVLDRVLQLDPEKRPSAAEVLRLPFFATAPVAHASATTPQRCTSSGPAPTKGVLTDRWLHRKSTGRSGVTRPAVDVTGP